jgi:hypothetical protein
MHDTRRTRSPVLVAVTSTLVLVVALALAGCEVSRVVTGPRTWTTTVETISGRTSTVSVRDGSGRIEDARVDADVGPLGDIANPPGQPNVVLVNWVGGACDERTDITIAEAASGLSIEIRTTAAPGDCDAIGIGHVLRLTGSGPLPAASIVVSQPRAGS